MLNAVFLRLHELDKDGADSMQMMNRANSSYLNYSFSAAPFYNANILWKNSAKKLLAFHPATTNPQETTRLTPCIYPQPPFMLWLLLHAFSSPTSQPIVPTHLQVAVAL